MASQDRYKSVSQDHDSSDNGEYNNLNLNGNNPTNFNTITSKSDIAQRNQRQDYGQQPRNVLETSPTKPNRMVVEPKKTLNFDFGGNYKDVDSSVKDVSKLNGYENLEEPRTQAQGLFGQAAYFFQNQFQNPFNFPKQKPAESIRRPIISSYQNSLPSSSRSNKSDINTAVATTPKPDKEEQNNVLQSESNSSISSPLQDMGISDKINEKVAVSVKSRPSKPSGQKRILVDLPVVSAKKVEVEITDLSQVFEGELKPKFLHLYFRSSDSVRLHKSSNGPVLNVVLYDINSSSIETVMFYSSAEKFQDFFTSLAPESVVKLAVDFYFYLPPKPFVNTAYVHKLTIGSRAILTSCAVPTGFNFIQTFKMDLFDVRGYIRYFGIQFPLEILDDLDVISEVLALNEQIRFVIVANTDTKALFKFNVNDKNTNEIVFGKRLRMQKAVGSYVDSALDGRLSKLLELQPEEIPTHFLVISLTTTSTFEVTTDAASYFCDKLSDLEWKVPKMFFNGIFHKSASG